MSDSEKSVRGKRALRAAVTADYHAVIHWLDHRVEVDRQNGIVSVMHDGTAVHPTGERDGMGAAMVFAVIEDGEQVLYDILIAGGSASHCFIGRSGTLIFSDAPGLCFCHPHVSL